MAATKRSGKKGGAAKGGGAAKKGGRAAKKAGATRGGATRGGTRGFGSVLSNIGNLAGTVGSIAGAAGGLGGGRRGELRVAAPPDAGIGAVVAALRRGFKEAGCPGCRSGYDRIVFEDIAARGGR